MIHIAPGHEKSISLEILFKALRLLPRKAKAEINPPFEGARVISFSQRL